MKKLMLAILIFSLVLSFANPSFAAKKEYEVKTLDQFLEIVKSKQDSKQFKEKKDKLKGKNAITDEEKTLLKSTDPTVIEQYNALMEEELRNFTISGESSEAEYKLEKSGITIAVETETVTTDEQPLSATNTLLMDKELKSLAPITTATYRANGSYSYSIKYKIRAIGWPDAVAGLVTNYSVRSDGLRVNWASTSGTSGFFPTSITGSSSVTDSRAERIGYDINAQGNYTVTIGGYNGIGIITFDMTLISRILWTGTNTVSQSYSESGDRSQ
ncbi:hypothetical protein [Planococcus sp. CAU13]|uniref:hypothetical protein n=1 Tax=Planococcus sp. CAU13 TaxID=1541197 RepID=UPI00052FE5BB|nr:hypothetical protein [Planococcus sp. CAU13]